MNKAMTAAEVVSDFRSHTGNGTAPISKSAVSPVYPSSNGDHAMNDVRRNAGTKPMPYDEAADRGSISAKNASSVTDAKRV